MGRYGTLLWLLVLLTGPPVAAGEPLDALIRAAIETEKLGAILPADVVLKDVTGRQVRVGDLLAQRPVLLAPVDFDCQNICGITLGGLLTALDQLEWRPGEDYDLLVPSIDPASTVASAKTARDEQLTRFESLVGSGVRFLAGDASALTSAIGFRYGYDPNSDQYIHPAAVAVVTPEGRLSRWLYGYPFEASDIRLALIEAGGGTIGTLGDRLWQLCYGYDPTTGRYTAAIDRLLKAGGGLTALLLGGFVLVMLRRERRAPRGGR
jgi:protein SCO1/2